LGASSARKEQMPRPRLSFHHLVPEQTHEKNHRKILNPSGSGGQWAPLETHMDIDIHFIQLRFLGRVIDVALV